MFLRVNRFLRAMGPGGYGGFFMSCCHFPARLFTTCQFLRNDSVLLLKGTSVNKNSPKVIDRRAGKKLQKTTDPCLQILLKNSRQD